MLVQAGKSSEAATEYRKALAILHKLTDDSPTFVQYRGSMAVNHNELGGNVFADGQAIGRRGRVPQGAGDLSKAGRRPPRRHRLSQQPGTKPSQPRQSARDMGKSSEAEAEYRKALAIRKKLADDNPAVTEFRNLTAFGHNNLGNLLRNTGNPWAADAEYGKALAIFQKLVDDNPSVPQFHRRLADNLDIIGWRLAQTGKLSEAIGYYMREEAIRRQLAEASSATPEDTNSLANCQTNLADVLRRSGRLDEAIAACERALGVARAAG